MKLLNTELNTNSNAFIGTNYAMDFFMQAARIGKRVYKSGLAYSLRTKKPKIEMCRLLLKEGFLEQHVELKRCKVEDQLMVNINNYRDENILIAIYIKGSVLIDLRPDAVDCEIIIISTNKREYQKIINTINNNFETIPKEPLGNVYSLVADNETLSIQNIGLAGLDFERENYEDKVLEDLDHIITDLGSDIPCGRLILINGVPGSGKTSLIRMLTKVVNRTFIYVPSHQVVEWSSPTIINVLNDIKKTNLFPLIFIIEDADSCLVPRQGTDVNINAISALLNLSDGILGSLFDIRIIATTNATLDQYDPAIVRNGRLCKKININQLNPDKANKIFKRITKEERDPFKKHILLADIYKYIKDPTAVKEMDKIQSRRVGFV